MTTIRELLATAEALRALGYTVYTDMKTGVMIVVRDDSLLGALRFPVDEGDEEL